MEKELEKNNHNLNVSIATLPVEEITIDPLLSSLFPIDDDVYQNILQDMNNTGFNPLFPIVLTSFRGKNSVLLDGHTRLKAAKEQKYPRVPVIYEYFYNPEEVVQFALALQISTRRNTTDYQIATTVRALLNDSSGVVNREMLFEQFSRSPVSRRKLDDAIRIAKYAVQEEWEMLKNGATFNAVKERIQKGNAPLTSAPAAVVTSTTKQTETTRTGDETKVNTTTTEITEITKPAVAPAKLSTKRNSLGSTNIFCNDAHVGAMDYNVTVELIDDQHVILICRGQEKRLELRVIDV